MFKSFKGLILTLILAAGVVGCSSYQTTEAEQLLEEARSHYQKALNFLDSFSKKVQKQNSSIPLYQKELKEAMTELNKAQSELEVTAKSIERIKELQVEEWRIKHAELLIKSIEKEEEAIKYARNYIEGMQTIMSSVNLLEVSTKEIQAGQKYLDRASTAISKKKYTEADSNIKKAKKHFEQALDKARQLKTSGLEGIKEYEKFILTLIKLTNQFNELNQALKKSQTSSAKKILKQIEATTDQLKKINLSGLSADEVIDDLFKQFTEKLNQLEAEAESFRNSADQLYQENTR